MSKSVPAHFLRSGRGLTGSKWGAKWHVWPVWACCTPAKPDGQKVDFFGQKAKNFPGSTKVKYGSRGPYWVSKSVSAHFLRSGRGLAGLKYMFGGFCTARRSKVDLFGQKSKKIWVQEGHIWVWGTILGIQKCFHTLFELRARYDRAQMGHQMAVLTCISLLHASTPRGSKSRLFGQKSQNFPGSNKVKYGSVPPISGPKCFHTFFDVRPRFGSKWGTKWPFWPA